MPAMGVSGELQVDAGRVIAENVPRAVIQQHHGKAWQRQTSSAVNSARVPVDASDPEMGVWSESCTFDAPLMWRWPAGSSFAESEERTLLLPQINWTSIADRTDYQHEWTSEVVVQRMDGYELVESNPEFATYDSYYFYTSFVRWNAERGSVANVAWTDQPLQIYRDRSVTLDDGRLTLWGGVLLGIAVTFALYLVSKLYDGAWALLAARKRARE